jgi:hypothetical protein
MSSESAEFWARLSGSSMMGLSASGSRELCDRLPGSPQARRWTAVKGGVAVPEGREDRRRSVSGAEDRSALEGWPAVGYSSCPVAGVRLGVQLIGLCCRLRSDRMVTAGRSPLPIKVGVGMPVIRMPGISSRSERMVGCGHSQAGSITFSTSPPQWESCRYTNARPGCARSGSSGLLA